MTGERCRPGRRFVPDAATAAGDLKAPRSRDAGEYKVVGAVVMSRDASGNVNVTDHGGGEVAGGAGL